MTDRKRGWKRAKEHERASFLFGGEIHEKREELVTWKRIKGEPESLLEMASPSDYMREYYRSINRNFTDYELAAVLWSSCMERTEVLRAIKELSETTADSRLKQQGNLKNTVVIRKEEQTIPQMGKFV